MLGECKLPASPASTGYCLNPSSAWIPLLTSGAALAYTPPSVALYGMNGTQAEPLQCDASGNLIFSSFPKNATDPATCSVAQVEFNTTSNVPKYCYPANTWNAFGGGGSGTVTGSGTANTYAIWTAAGAIGNGTISTAAGVDTDTNTFNAPSVSAGTPSVAASAACTVASGSHCLVFDESSAAGVPAASVDYIRSDSTSHRLKQSLNNGAEVNVPIPSEIPAAQVAANLASSGATGVTPVIDDHIVPTSSILSNIFYFTCNHTECGRSWQNFR